MVSRFIVEIALVAALSAALAARAFRLQGDIGLTLSEEGHLWYVTERTALGDVPFGDFREYEPGRYYVGALWFKVFGSGILALRAVLSAVAAAGLLCGLLAVRRSTRAWWITAVMAVLLFAWIAPLYKAYETAFPLAAICVALALIERPDPRRFFATGVFTGFAGFFRIDHALYAAIAFGAVTLLLGAVAIPLVVLISYATVDRQSPYVQKASAPEGAWVKTAGAGDLLWLPRGTSAFLDTVSRINRLVLRPDDSILIAPFWPDLHAVLGRQAPLWETYFLALETEARQRTIIEQLRRQHVNWALIADVVLDGRDESRFRNTYRVVWAHLGEEFEVVPVDGLPAPVTLLRRREPIRSATR